ncbi:MAG: glutaminyl-peptide cyclotransferase [bacterium]|nr:glutaminyl-peptide cyclotransferase [bacterium]
MPHDKQSFTQGLLLYEGFFYESAGLYGESDVRKVDPATGFVLQSVDLPSSEFGEGLARVGDELIQLTWQENVAHRWTVDGLSDIGSFSYGGQGWGLCHDGSRLVMSNGSNTLFFRDPQTFALEGQVTVTVDGSPIDRLNELECVGDLVYANVWLTDTILRIDPSSGAVLTSIDASGLLTPAEETKADVLNGIAFDPSTHRFFLTGKLWPKVFEVEFDFNPYGAGFCAVQLLEPVPDLEAKRSGDGIEFTWGEDLNAAEYHVNSVSSLSALPDPGLHRPDVAGGMGESACDAAAGAESCIDEDALLAPEALRFYKVFSACGPLGADEGP